jgi:hypothetical protein
VPKPPKFYHKSWSKLGITPTASEAKGDLPKVFIPAASESVQTDLHESHGFTERAVTMLMSQPLMMNAARTCRYPRGTSEVKGFFSL